jgi:hypothetical protein
MTRERAIHGFGWLLLIFAACLASASGTIALIADANPPVRELAAAAANQQLNAMGARSAFFAPLMTLGFVAFFAWKAGARSSVGSMIASDVAEERNRSTRRILFVSWMFSMWISSGTVMLSLSALATHTSGPLTNSTAFVSLGNALGTPGLMCCFLASVCLPMSCVASTTTSGVNLHRTAAGPTDWLVLKACRGFVRLSGVAGRLFRRIARGS